MILNPAGHLWSPPIWVDYMAHDADWRVPLDFPGTIADLSEHNIQLAEGMRLVLYTHDATEASDDLVTIGTVERIEESDRWFARFDWQRLVHVSDLDAAERMSYLQAKRPD